MRDSARLVHGASKRCTALQAFGLPGGTIAAVRQAQREARRRQEEAMGRIEPAFDHCRRRLARDLQLLAHAPLAGRVAGGGKLLAEARGFLLLHSMLVARAKQLDALRQAGDSVNALLSQNVQIQKQLAAGHLDVVGGDDRHFETVVEF